MFLQTPLKQICEDLSATVSRGEEEQVRLQAQEKRLAKDLETTDHAIEEIVGKEQKTQ